MPFASNCSGSFARLEKGDGLENDKVLGNY